jgi:hypothetical protein
MYSLRKFPQGVHFSPFLDILTHRLLNFSLGVKGRPRWALLCAFIPVKPVRDFYMLHDMVLTRRSAALAGAAIIHTFLAHSQVGLFAIPAQYKGKKDREATL